MAVFIFAPLIVFAEYQIYAPGAQVTVGDFVYDDSFNATSSPCSIVIADPSGNNVVTATTTGDSTGWHSYTFTPTPVSGPTTGVWPAVLSCGSSLTGDLLREDRSFIVGAASVDTTTLSSTINNASSAIGSLINGLNNVSTSSVASAVWNNPTRTLTDYSTSSIASAIWTSPTRTLSSFGTLVSDVAAAVWSSGSRTLTAFGSLAADVWNNTYAPTRELTDKTLTSGGQLASQADVVNASSSIITAVLNNTTLINNLHNISAADVWAYGSRTVTGGTVDLTASSTQAIWSIATSTLASTGGSIGQQIVKNLDTTVSSRGTATITAADIWSAATRTLTDYSTSSIATAVWANAARTLTNYGNNIQASDVWNVLTSSLTTTGSIGAQVAGVSTSTIASAVWNNPTRNLTDYATSSIASAVWTNPTRSLTSFGTLVSDITTSIWSNGSRTLTALGSVAADVWNNTYAPTRELTDQTLTSGGKIATQTDVTNASSSIVTAVLNNATLIGNLNNISAADVWAYGTRSLNGSGGTVDLTASSTQAIWNIATSTLSSSGSIGKQLVTNLDTTISSRGTATITAADIWSAATRTLTDYSTSSVATAVWANAARTLTNYGNDITAADVWNTLTSTLTTAGSVGQQVAGVSTSTIASAVWNNPTRNLTDYATSSIASAVWTSPTRTLSSFGTLVSDITTSIWSNSSRTLTALGSVAADVWNNTYAPTRELTDQTLTGGGKIATQADINNASSSIVTAVLNNTALINSLNNISAADVWAYGSRSLTGSAGTVDLTASSTLAIWNVAKSSLTANGSVGQQIANNLDATISSRSTSTLTAADIWSAATRTLTDYSTSSLATAVWTNAARTLTNYGNDITAADVWNVLTSSLTTSGSVGAQVAGLSTSGSSTIVSAGWVTTLSHTQDILQGNSYRATVYVTNGINASDSFAAPSVTLYDADRNPVVSNISMTKIGTGIYEYVYSVPSTAVQGQWETIVQTQVTASSTIQTSGYWEVSGSPAQVIISGMAGNTVPTASANVTITNEGLSGYEYHYEWCVVPGSSDVCGGGNDIFYESAAKFISAGQNWNTTLSANVPNPGSYYFKVVVYYGTKSSGSSRTFTEVAQSSSPPPSGGGAGGGGFSSNPAPSPTPALGTCNGADLNHDSKVNSVDFSILLYFWQTQPPFANSCVDINHDSKVNSVDFSILLYQWGSGGIPFKKP